MLDTRHDLHSQFPEDGDIIGRLKTENAHFRTLAKRFDDLNEEILHIEIKEKPVADEQLENMKKNRLELLDQIAALIAAAR